ncbi:Nudix family hydrolase [Lysobacter humi (ex Lee et al. 2017)]
MVHVVAAVLRDVRGRVLLARRTEGRDLAGLWEFPGGKCEAGESAHEALVRELREELGIEARIGAPLIRVPQQYSDKRLVLDVHLVDGWAGSARGREGQALAWVPLGKLARYAMPPADRPVVAALTRPAYYALTPEAESPEAWLAQVEALLARGARRVQLRSRLLAASDGESLAAAAVMRCHAAGAEVLASRDIELARRLGIGVHLAAAQVRALAARPLSEDVAVAASCHDAVELEAAQALDCDFAVLGSVQATASHPGVAPLGWQAFARLREGVALPIYAIGGLDASDLATARAHGAQGVAAMRGFLTAPAALG